MTFKLFRKSPLVWLYAGGAVLLLAAAAVWCFKISLDPERVFWATIERGLATRAVTVQAKQESAGTTADQTIRISFGAENRSHSLTTLSQGGTLVKTEMIGTPTLDYTRYVNVITDQKKVDGTPIDPSKILGVWAKGQEGTGQFFNQAVFGFSMPVGGMGVPIGHLSPEHRATLVKQIRDDVAYQLDFSKTKKEWTNGRLLYTYDISVQPVGYIAMMKQLSSLTGLHSLDDVNPKDYTAQEPFGLKVTIDVRSRQVVRVSSPERGSEQNYVSYDVPVQIALPTNAISGTEMQKLLSDLQ